jgi:hypothetical protein
MKNNDESNQVDDLVTGLQSIYQSTLTINKI